MFVTLRKIVDTTYNDEGGAVDRTVAARIDPSRVRCFYPRRNDKPGTRITFSDGGGFAVADSLEAVEAALGSPLPRDAATLALTHQPL